MNRIYKATVISSFKHAPYQLIPIRIENSSSQATVQVIVIKAKP